MTRGIIIAAGRGVRMGELAEDRPKCLLPVGDKTLLDFTVQRMRDVGCEEIVVIIGYRAEAITRADLIRVQNPEYLSNNILHSLMKAREYMEGPVVVSYSDIWVEPEIYSQLMAANGDIVIAADRDWSPYYEGRTDHPLHEAENVILNDKGKVMQIGKHLGAEDVRGHLLAEFLGLWRMTAKGTQAFCNAFDAVDRVTAPKDENFQNAKEWQKAYITDLLQEMADCGHEVLSAVIERGWAELDTVQDYERLPEIAEQQRLMNYLKQTGST